MSDLSPQLARPTVGAHLPDPADPPPASHPPPHSHPNQPLPATDTPESSASSTTATATAPGPVSNAASVPSDKPGPPADDPFLVTFQTHPNLNPLAFSLGKKRALTALAGLLVLNSTFASSGPSNLLPALREHFGFSAVIGALTIAIFVAGYCVGPLLWGPLSERFGRRIIFIVAFVPYIAFQIGAALAQTTAQLLVFRFLGGCFAASPLTNSGALISDLFDADSRGVALAIFSLAPFAGPALAPVISGALYVRNVDWRWMFWILAIFAGVCLTLIVFCLPETHAPTILRHQAQKLRKETGDERWHSAGELAMANETRSDLVKKTLVKPFVIIVEEPMLLALTIYMSFVYGIIYLLFEAVPIIFIENHGLNLFEVGLIFIALPVGGAIAVLTYIFYFNRRYVRIHHEIKPAMVPPEERLLPMMAGAIALAVSFFWIGWTAYPSISIASPILGIVLLGFGVLYVFLSIFNYIIDSYLRNAASALAINTVCRSAFGAGFPLFAAQMYVRLGIPGASSLLGGLALVFLPIPFLLYKYGARIRAMSKNAFVLPGPGEKPKAAVTEKQQA